MVTIEYHKTKVNATASNYKRKKGMGIVQKYLKCNEVAEMFGVRVITVWDWIRKKKLPAVQIGRNYRVRPEDIKQFEREQITVKKN